MAYAFRVSVDLSFFVVSFKCAVLIAFEICSPAWAQLYITGDPEWAHIIERAVALHSDFRLPSGLSARERLFCTITRDADKVDIMRVFNRSSCEAVLGIDPDEFSHGEISDVAYEASGERRCLVRDERPGSLDGLVGAVCLAFELELPASHKALGDRGYLQALLREPFGLSPHFESELTQYRWDAICDVFSQ